MKKITFVLITLVILASLVLTACSAGLAEKPAVATQQVIAPTSVPTNAPAPTAKPTVAAPVDTEVNLDEPLNGTLDDFGALVRYTDRFAVNGTILDESLNPGEMIFGNAYSVHDNGYVGTPCVAFYYVAPEKGGRVRLTGFDGIYFIVDANKMTLNQGIAAMRQTLTNAHNCEKINFHELVRYGDPVKE